MLFNEENHSNLYKCLQLLAVDNDVRLQLLAADNDIPPHGKKNIWPTFIDYDFLELQAATVSKSERDTFICGEEDEAKALLHARGIYQLDLFLCLVFDGALHKCYYF